MIIAVLLVIISVVAVNILRSPKSSTEKRLYRIPKALIITSGKDGAGTLPAGVVLAMESFISNGAYTRIETRDALLDKDLLYNFDILLLLTGMDIHDADKAFSLTFMEDAELEILRGWVEAGGVLIAGDNFGRNTRNGVDRISLFGRLEPGNWLMSECFGVVMSERNMEGFSLNGELTSELKGEFIPKLGEEAWMLVADSIVSPDVKVLANWDNDTIMFPALIMNSYGDGVSFLLPSSYLMHPSNEGGLWNAVQIDAFCKFILDRFYEKHPVRFELRPWPNAHQAAFAVSFNCDGCADNFNNTFKMLKKKNVNTTLFVNGDVGQQRLQFLKNLKINLQSNGYTKTNMRDLSFSETVYQIELNEYVWMKNFSGFRFPFTMNSSTGMDYLDRKGYIYDSSIGIDHTKGFYGSVFPYNIPVAYGDVYKVLNMLEIGPVSLDDYYFFKMIQDDAGIAPSELYSKALLYEQYLKYFWQYIALPKGGMMVYLGHPMYTGYNDTTLVPLANLIDTVKADDAWITSMEDIASRWRIIDKMSLNVDSYRNDHYCVTVNLPGDLTLERVTLKTDRKPKRVKANKGKVIVKSAGSGWLIVFDAFNDQTVDVDF